MIHIWLTAATPAIIPSFGLCLIWLPRLKVSSVEKVNMKKIISVAPARTCLFGDHQDYMKLPVIACAIDRHITLTAVANETGTFHIDKVDLDEKRDIPIAPVTGEVEKGDHFLSSLAVLARYDCVPDRGYHVTITGNIPINAGTSSSSAVVIAWIGFLLQAFGSDKPVTPQLLSQIAYEAEVLEQGDPGGKMDQYSIGLGHVIYLETDDRADYEIFKKDLDGLIVGESGIPKQTVAVLAELKGAVFAAINQVKQNEPAFKLASVRPDDLPKYLTYLPKGQQVYLKAAVLNHDITQRARLEFLKDEWDLHAIGKLMNEHHTILKEDLRITVPRIDAMIDAALAAGALGAKIVGSGRGGSIVVLAPPTEKEQVIRAIKDAGGKDAYAVNVDPGARIL